MTLFTISTHPVSTIFARYRLLLGSLPNQKPDLAKLASPVAHLDKADPPLLLIHGEADPQMPPQQSSEFARAYKDAGLTVTHITLPKSKHGGDEFYDEARTKIMADFLKKHLNLSK